MILKIKTIALSSIAQLFVPLIWFKDRRIQNPVKHLRSKRLAKTVNGRNP